MIASCPINPSSYSVITLLIAGGAMWGLINKWVIPQFSKRSVTKRDCENAMAKKLDEEKHKDHCESVIKRYESQSQTLGAQSEMLDAQSEMLKGLATSLRNSVDDNRVYLQQAAVSIQLQVDDIKAAVKACMEIVMRHDAIIDHRQAILDNHSNRLAALEKHGKETQ